jgi:heme-degrading monooxygenase HmoA
MILEVAEFRVRPGEQAAFEAAMTCALQTITAKAPGASSYRFTKCVESPERYLLQVTWKKLEDHMVGYRQSAGRDAWRALVSPFYAEPPRMEHFCVVTESEE